MDTIAKVEAMFQVMKNSMVIQTCTDLLELKRHFHNAINPEYSGPQKYNHPQTFYDFGVAFLIRGDIEFSKDAFLKGSHFGLKYPCVFYDDNYIDAVGQCFANLTMKFGTLENELDAKLTALAYIYLSRCIELHPDSAYDSYRTRALLTASINNNYAMDNLFIPKVNLPGTQIILSFADFYKSYMLSGSQDSLVNAKNMIQPLKDANLYYEGRSINDFSLETFSAFGLKIHEKLFKTLKRNYELGHYDVTINQIKNI